MKNNYELKDLFDADLNQSKFGQNQREKILVSNLVESAKMPQVKTSQ